MNGILTTTFLAITDLLLLQRKTLTLELTVDYTSELEKKVDYVTRYNSKAYYKTALKRVSQANPGNAKIICDYIIAEQSQMNIKESTKEGKIKVLIWLTNNFRNKKSFREISKQDILDYPDSLRKPVSDDPTHKWIGISYNGRQMIFNKFFRGYTILMSQIQRKD